MIKFFTCPRCNKAHDKRVHECAGCGYPKPPMIAPTPEIIAAAEQLLAVEPVLGTSVPENLFD